VTVTVFGIVAIILTASGAFLHVRNAMNTIWRVPPPPHKKRGIMGDLGAFALRRLRAFALVFPLGLVLIVSLAVSTVLRVLRSVLPLGGFGLDLLNLLVSLGVLTLGLGVIFRFLPDVRLRWGEIWRGAVITALLFSVGNELLTRYLTRTATASVFGAAGSVVIFLIWVYYSAQITLYGAEYSHVFFRVRRWRRALAPHIR
jgi:membrane protein